MPAISREIEAPIAMLSALWEARRRTDALFDIVRRDSLYERPIPERHRIIFYIGHLEAFDRNLLNGRLLSLPNPSSDLDKLFAFGIDPVGGGLPSDQPSDWPTLDRVRGYVEQVRDELDEGLVKLVGESQAAREFSPEQLLNVAVEHRLMHAETLAYMLHRLPFDRKVAPAMPVSRLAPVRANSGMLEIPEGLAVLGLSRGGDAFGWDNEFERNSVNVEAFTIDRYKTTNAEYMGFMNDDGYRRRELWNDADWAWKESQNISAPAFWERHGGNGEWVWRGMFAEIPLDPDWPVYVSHAEASAYARWAGKSLPTEAQWQRAAYGSVDGQSRHYPWGSKPAEPRRGNFDFENWDPVSVAAHPAGISAFGAEDILGNGWEWTSTVFAPFAGFQPFPFYPGYSADFFDGKHYVIKGASPRTAACMLRPSFRNWFQPHYQYVYAGFRCVSNGSRED
jgi:ergothioneine biosynthesis protein EgtB